MIDALLRRRLARAAAAVISVGVSLAVAMQASRVLAPLVGARATWLELVAALLIVAALALPAVVAIGAGLAGALAVGSLASDGARDALRAHGVGPVGALRGALPAGAALGALALAASTWLEPLAAREAIARGGDLALRAASAALEDGRVLPLGDDAALALEPRSRTLVLTSGPDARGEVRALRARLLSLRFPVEARLGRGSLHLRREGPAPLSISLGFARARWPLPSVVGAAAGATGTGGSEVLPAARLVRPTGELLARAGADAASRALLARRLLPALVALLAALAPVVLGWTWRRPGALFVLSAGVLPAVLALGVARGLERAAPAGLAEVAALGGMAAMLAVATVVRRVAAARSARW